MRRAEYKKLFDSDAFEQAYHTDAALGAYTDGERTRFLLWAPTARRVMLSLYRDGSEGDAYDTLPLMQGERGVWSTEIPGDLHGVYYDYLVTVDRATRRTADPYARACGVNGHRSMVVDLARTNPEGWAQDCAPQRQSEDIIYELHVKDFSWDPASGANENERGKYAALCRTDTTLDGAGEKPTLVSYIRDLGVTHVQLLPVYDYGSVDEDGDPNAFNWGYDPVNYNIPDGSYASDAHDGTVRIRELKAAIMALHQSGLRVVMDVVYNHTYSLESNLFKAVPWYYYRQKKDGSASNGSGCGSELASERSMCGKYILDSVLYWAQEYHIDGFRFDLMGLHDAELMKAIRSTLDARFGEGEKLVYGEPWCGGTSCPREGTCLCDKAHLRELGTQIGAFCDATRDAIKGGLMSPQARGFVGGENFNAGYMACCIKGWVGEEADMTYRAASQTISYLSCHDDWTLWDKLVYSLTDGRDFESLNPQLLRANRLAAAMLFCCQGRLFMLSGEEFGRTKQGVKNSYRSPLSINRVDWRRAWENAPLADYYRGLIALRKRLPGLCDKTITAAARIQEAWDIAPGAARIQLDNRGEGSEYDMLCLLFNTTQRAMDAALPDGEWVLLVDGESSRHWQKRTAIGCAVRLAPMSALIAGRRSGQKHA